MKRSVRKLVNIAAIATALAAAPSFAFDGQVNSDAYGGVDTPAIEAEVQGSRSAVALDESQIHGQVSGDAYGGVEKSAIAKTTNVAPSDTLHANNQPFGQVSDDAYGGE